MTLWTMRMPFMDYLHLATGNDRKTPFSIVQRLPPYADYDLHSGIYGGHVGERRSPAAEVKIKDKAFGADFFSFGGCMFASERLREAMALAPTEIRYFEIDDKRSAPLVRSMKYQIMEPTVFEDVLDPERTQYETDGSPAEAEYGPLTVRREHIRADAAPAHDLFYDRVFKTIMLCTDRFAVRLLQAGCTGMEFVDTCSNDGVERRRTLHGIEVDGVLDRNSMN